MNQIRIIGGEWKRRIIRFESVEGLRPTPDRIRETLFNWLMWDISGRHVLDLCAGSGALGLEALSRGAASCIFVEPDRKQATTLSKNIEQFGAQQRAQVWNCTAQQAKVRLTHPIDVLFLDPPYTLNLWSSLAQQYQDSLAPNAWIYVEADRELTTLDLPSEWQLHRQTRAGMVQSGLFRRTLS
jgi:16S rRNA (guanine966-N2)-methyltransferase